MERQNKIINIFKKVCDLKFAVFVFMFSFRITECGSPFERPEKICLRYFKISQTYFKLSQR